MTDTKPDDEKWNDTWKYIDEHRALEREFAMNTRFLYTPCRFCGGGKKRIHLDVMRERGLSGKHAECWEFLKHCSDHAQEVFERRQQLLFWKPWLYRRRSEAEKQAYSLGVRRLMIALFPEDPSAATYPLTEFDDSKDWMKISTWRLIKMRYEDLTQGHR
jgi:hypothetical protein